MREIIVPAVLAVVLALDASDASAMEGGNLAPGESPYAILVPQTVAPTLAPIAASQPSTSIPHRAPARPAHHTERTP